MGTAFFDGHGRFRVFPSRADRQRFARETNVCAECLGGTCCQSEDAIYLTAFDILRLSTFLDLSPADFLRRFTQEGFQEGPLEPYRRETIDRSGSSIVTYLRRRSNRSYSPCIFLKYVRDARGTPRRICSVYHARPLACREYYYHHCKMRGTGELAALQAHAFELIRDGTITLEIAQTQRARLRPLVTEDAPMSAYLEYAVWTEAWRALQPELANEEGVNAYDISAYQDHIDIKIDRLLSKERLRLEERYGWIPHGDQLQRFDDGLRFAGSPEHRRLLRIVEAPPSHGLFEDGDYPYFAANRLAVPGMLPPRRFKHISAVAKRRLVAAACGASAFPKHRDPRVRTTTAREIWTAAIAAADALVTFADYVAALGQVLEVEPAGTMEREILSCLRELEQHPVVSVHPGFPEIRRWAETAVRASSLAARRAKATTNQRAAPKLIRRLLDRQQPDGTWTRDPQVSLLPESQADYLRSWLYVTAEGLAALRP